MVGDATASLQNHILGASTNHSARAEGMGPIHITKVRPTARELAVERSREAPKISHVAFSRTLYVFQETEWIDLIRMREMGRGLRS